MKSCRHVLFGPAWSGPVIWVRAFLLAAAVGLAVTVLLPGSLAAQGNDEPHGRLRVLPLGLGRAALGLLVGHEHGAQSARAEVAEQQRIPVVPERHAGAHHLELDHPTRTAGLVLAGSFASYSANAGLVEFWESSVSQLRDPVDPAFAREFQASTLASPIAPQFFELVMRECLKVPASVWRQAFEGFLADDFSQELEAIRAPTLLLWGERDTLSPRRDQEIALEAIQNAALVVYQSTGHAVQWEQPRRFGADLVAFINTHVDGLSPQAAVQ